MRKACVDKIVAQLNLDNSSVFMDIGSGLGDVVFEVADRYGCKSVGIELHPRLFQETALVMGNVNAGLYPWIKSVNFVFGDAEAVLTKTGLAPCTHLYLFSKCMTKKLIQNIGKIANSCSSLLMVTSYHDLPSLGWQRLKLHDTVRAQLRGSGEGASMKIYQVEQAYFIPPVIPHWLPDHERQYDSGSWLDLANSFQLPRTRSQVAKIN